MDFGLSKRIGNSESSVVAVISRCEQHSYSLCTSVPLYYLQVSPTDGLPAVVCRKCRDQLDGFYRFRENALTIERRLKEYLASTKLHQQLFAAAATKDCSEVSFFYLIWSNWVDWIAKVRREQSRMGSWGKRANLA